MTSGSAVPFIQTEAHSSVKLPVGLVLHAHDYCVEFVQCNFEDVGVKLEAVAYLDLRSLSNCRPDWAQFRRSAFGCSVSMPLMLGRVTLRSRLSLG